MTADIRHALRLYGRTPVASGIAVVVLAVAVAFVTAFLSLYVDLALRPHRGFDQSGRLMTLGQTDGQRLVGLPARVFDLMADEMSSLDGVAGLSVTSTPGPPEQRYTAELVTQGFFPVLRPRLSAGRGLEAADHDPEAAGVVVISYRYWQDALGGTDVIGTTVELEFVPLVFSLITGSEAEDNVEDRQYRIVGIMSPEMTGTLRSGTSLWLPYERVVDGLIQIPDEQMRASFRDDLTVDVLGRRSEGASVASVVRELGSRYGSAGEGTFLRAGYRFAGVGGAVPNLNVYRESTRQLRLFLAASVLMALVAAANVSLFLLARAPGRRRELGIRLAVGAPLGRIARQLATEAGLLVVVAAALGFVMSVWLGGLLRGLAFLRQTAWRDVSLLDWRVLALAGAFLVLLTALVSLAPILGLRRLGIAASSRAVAARASLAQRVAGAFQVTIAGMLGGAAVAFGWYLLALTFGDPGYELRNRLIVSYSLGPQMDQAQFQQLMERSVVELTRRRDAIEAIPGVSAATFGTPVPGQNGSGTIQISDPDDPTTPIRLRTGSIDSRYVDVLGLRLLHGRTLSDGEAGAVLVNQTLARRLFGRDDVVGEIMPTTSPTTGGEQIVGVLEDLSFDHPAADVEPFVFRPYAATMPDNVLVDTTLSPDALRPELERLLEAGITATPVGNVRPLREPRDRLLAPDRARAWLTAAAAAIVVLLAAYGFYGTQRYLVAAGRREYAIRASIGAGPKALGHLVISRGLMLGLPGLVLGSMLAFITVAWLRDDFVSRDVSAFAVTTVVAAGLVLLLAAASFGPARQAMRTQPAPLLREE